MKLKDFSLRIEDEELKKLHYISDYNDRSVNRELLRVIRQHIAKFEAENGPIEIHKSEELKQ